MKLMIIESPGKVKKLSSILGPDFKTIASFGHVRDRPESGISSAAPVSLSKRDFAIIWKRGYAALRAHR